MNGKSKQMYIKSLNIEYTGQKVISDIDDCLIYSSRSIRKHKLLRRVFFMNKEIFDKHKYTVFNNVELTDWGIELRELIKSRLIVDYMLITSAYDRMSILTDILGINEANVMDRMSNTDKIEYLNSIDSPALYIDDKLSVIQAITNKNVTCINYPKREIIPFNKTMKANVNRRNRSAKRAR